jgi:hypothetical protein
MLTFLEDLEASLWLSSKNADVMAGRKAAPSKRQTFTQHINIISGV